MKKFTKIIFHLLLTIAVTSTAADLCIAQKVTKKGTAAATFLRIPIGARASGMGSSFASIDGDPSAVFWNPANVASISSPVLTVDHALWLPGIDFDFAGVIIPIENFGNIGVNVSILHTDEMEVTTVQEPMGTGETFVASSFALGVTYSKSLTDRFAIGGSFKYIQENIFNSDAKGIAFDIGTIYVTPFAGIRLGASISNFGSKMQITGEDLNVRVDIAPDQEGNNQSIIGTINTDQFDLPLIMRIGISGEVFNSENFRLTLSADGINPNDNEQSVNLGGEIALFREMVRLRGGYKDLFLDENESGYTFGAGINEVSLISGVSFTVEYAYQDFIHLKGSNRFTLTLKF